MSLLPTPYAPSSLSPDELEPYISHLVLHSLGASPALPSSAWSAPSSTRDRAMCALGSDKCDGLSDGELRVLAATVARRVVLAVLRSDAVRAGMAKRRIRGGGPNWTDTNGGSSNGSDKLNVSNHLGLGVPADRDRDRDRASSESPSPSPRPTPPHPAAATALSVPSEKPNVMGRIFSFKKQQPPSSAPPAPAPAAAPRTASTLSPQPAIVQQTASHSFSPSPAQAQDEIIQMTQLLPVLTSSYLQTLTSLRYNPVSIRRPAKPSFTTPQFAPALSRLALSNSAAEEKTEFGFGDGKTGEMKWKWGCARDLGGGKYVGNEDGVVGVPRLEEVVRIENIANPPAFFAIYDGHGPSPTPNATPSGPLASTYASIYLHAHLGSLLNEQATVETAIRGAFGETAAGLLKFRDRECPSADPGTTATVLLRFPGIGVNVDDDQPEYYLAHVGDSPCFLVSSTGHMHLLNPAHNATNPSEVARVTALGGKFFAPPNANANAPAKEREGPTERLQGYLACSRAIGDFGYRPCITSDPEILKFTTSGIPCPEDKGTWKFILLCSDGVSDFLGPALLGSVLLKGYKKGGEGYYYSGAEAAAREIVREAVKRGGWDNASCIVVEI